LFEKLPIAVTRI